MTTTKRADELAVGDRTVDGDTVTGVFKLYARGDGYGSVEFDGRRRKVFCAEAWRVARPYAECLANRPAGEYDFKAMTWAEVFEVQKATHGPVVEVTDDVAILMAGEEWRGTRYEFECGHRMVEPLFKS